MRSGKLAGAMKGHWVNGKAPYGYEYSHKTKKLIPDTAGNPSPSEIVKSIFNDALNGVSTSDIAYKLNRKGILSPNGSHWTSTTISRILHQEVYLGKTIYGKSSGSGHKNKKTTPLKFKDKSEWIIVNNAHPALILEEVFEEVQSQLNRRKKVIATRKSKVSTLSGLVRCGQCGSGLYIQRKPNNKNVIRSCWYKSPLGEKCTNKGVAESKVVEKILEKVREYRDELATAINKGEGGDTAKEAILKEIADLQKELQKVKNRLSRAMDAYDNGDYTREEYLERKEKYKNQQKDFESELELLNKELKKLDAVKDKDKLRYLDYVLNYFDRVTKEEDRNKILKAIISHVDLIRVSDKDEGEITVNFH
jgi:site-specific DNA recombinase